MKYALKCLKSRALWINAFSVATYIVNDTVLSKAIPIEYLAVAQLVLNTIGRLITKEAIEEKK